jgi:hypothetical protein
MFKRIAEIAAAIHDLSVIGHFDPPDDDQAARLAALEKRHRQLEAALIVMHIIPEPPEPPGPPDVPCPDYIPDGWVK